MSSIIVREKDQEPEIVVLDRPRMTIGRSSRADIPIRDPFASRLHAVLQQDGPYVLLADIGSSNSTLLNGAVVSRPRRLAPGDVILIGEAELTFVAHDKTSIPPPVTFVGGEDDSIPDSDVTVMKDPSALLATVHLRAAREATPESLRVTRELAKPRVDIHEIMSRVGLVLIQKSTVSEVLRTTMELVFEALPAERGFIFLKHGGDAVCKLAATPTALLPRNPPPRLSRTILARALNDGTMVRTADAGIDPRFKSAGSVEMNAIRSVLAVPLVAGGDVLGAIYVDNDIRNRFEESDGSVLATIAAVAAVKIEHERLLAEVQVKRRIQEELKIAGEIQARLLPMTSPDVPGWDFSGISLPCLEVGGDYFDFIKLPPRKPDDGRKPRVGIAVGDVSGKGTGAALLISSVHAGLRAEAQVGECVSEVMRKVNRYLSEYAPSNRFVTLFYGELDPDTGRLRYSNAGHEPPIVVRSDGTIERLREGGIAIGIKEDETYEEGEVLLLPGDVFVCYSDGISDSVNGRGERFGESRIVEVAHASRGKPASQVRDRIEEALSHFVGSTAPVDDMTLVVATRV